MFEALECGIGEVCRESLTGDWRGEFVQRWGRPERNLAFKRTRLTKRTNAVVTRALTTECIPSKESFLKCCVGAALPDVETVWKGEE